MDFESFSGIVEMDETYFLYSKKDKKRLKGRKPRNRGGSSKFRGISHEQVCILIAGDRKKSTFSGVLGRVRIVKTQLDKATGSKLSSDNTLCTDSWRAISTKAKDWFIIVLNLMELNVSKVSIIFKMLITITAD
jgi:hypothetical protein